MTVNQLLIAAGVLVVGVLLAALGRVLVNRLLQRLLPESDRSERQRRNAANGAFTFGVVVAAAAALSVLAPQLFADIPPRVLAYLPNVAVALVLLWLGAVLANLVEQLVRASLERVGLPNAGVFAKGAFWLILGLAIILAADQLGVQTAALQRLLLVALAIAGVAVALAAGLGGRALAGTVIAGRYVEERFDPGDRIAIGDIEGEIADIGLASTAVQLDDGDVVEVPHSYLLSRPVTRRAPDGASDVGADVEPSATPDDGGADDGGADDGGASSGHRDR